MEQIKIFKSKKIIQIINNSQITHQYPIGIGKNEQGHKQTRDDLRTPEGEYKICVKNNKSKFFLSLGLNYPNLQDAKDGLSKNVISKKQYDSIIKAHNTHGGSDWSTPLGGEIYIHGDLENKAWSEGCVRMNNQDIKSIYKHVKLGTRVSIYP